jgi:hypothetical protein
MITWGHDKRKDSGSTKLGLGTGNRPPACSCSQCSSKHNLSCRCLTVSDTLAAVEIPEKKRAVAIVHCTSNSAGYRAMNMHMNSHGICFADVKRIVEQQSELDLKPATRQTNETHALCGVMYLPALLACTSRKQVRQDMYTRTMMTAM